MLSPDQAQARAAALVHRARKAGADACDALFSANASESVSIRLGALEDVERSESEHIALRVFIGKRSSSIGSSDLSDAALDELAARAVAMARAAPEDVYAGLAPEEHLLKTAPPQLDLDSGEDASPQVLRAMAEAAEDAARSIAGITNSEGASAGAGRAVMALVTSHGFAGAYGGTNQSLSASVIAGEGGDMQRDYAWRTARYGTDLPSPESIGAQAGQRAVARLNPGTVKSGAMPVVFDPRVGGSLLGHLASAMAGPAIARRTSFLLEKAGAKLFDSGVTVIDDPLLLRGLRSHPFDGEGLGVAQYRLVDAGTLGGWLMDAAAARQLGGVPTGHAGHGGGVGTSNLHLAAGSITPTDLMADIADGVYITELIGMGVNGVTGDYSRGASGFRIVGGEIAGPVAEFTIAGNLIDMFAALIPANDLEWHRPVNVPTIRVDGMVVASQD